MSGPTPTVPTHDTSHRHCSQRANQNSYTTQPLCVGHLLHQNFGATFAKIIINEWEWEIWRYQIEQREKCCSNYLLIELVLSELEVISELTQVWIILEHLQSVVVALRRYESLHLWLYRRCYLAGLDLFGSAKGLIQYIILKSDVICSLCHWWRLIRNLDLNGWVSLGLLLLFSYGGWLRLRCHIIGIALCDWTAHILVGLLWVVFAVLGCLVVAILRVLLLFVCSGLSWILGRLTFF